MQARIGAALRYRLRAPAVVAGDTLTWRYAGRFSLAWVIGAALRYRLRAPAVAAGDTLPGLSAGGYGWLLICFG